jgi:hypothetical protein
MYAATIPLGRPRRAECRVCEDSVREVVLIANYRAREGEAGLVNEALELEGRRSRGAKVADGEALAFAMRHE